jgi:hypothetical protein
VLVLAANAHAQPGTQSAPAGSAHAQPRTQSALAERAFEDARALVDQNRWEEACARFEDSLRYEVALGTQLNLARCYKHIGKLASALQLFTEARDAAARAGDVVRRDYAQSKMDELAPRVPTLTVIGPPTRLDGLAVTQDGALIDADGGILRVNPGAHRIVASAPGREPFTQEVSLVEGGAETVEIPGLAVAVAAPASRWTPRTYAALASGAALDTPRDADGDAAANARPDEAPGLFVVRLAGGVALLSAADLGIPAQPVLRLTGGYPIRLAAMTLELGAALSYTPLPYEVMGAQKTGVMLGGRAAAVASYPITPKLSLRGELGLGVVSLSGLVAGNPLSANRTAGSFMLPSVAFGVALDYAVARRFTATVSPLSLALSRGGDGMYASSLRELDVVVGIGYWP